MIEQSWFINKISCQTWNSTLNAKTDLSEVDVARAVTLIENSKRIYQEVAEMLGVSKSTIPRVVQRYHNIGQHKRREDHPLGTIDLLLALLWKIVPIPEVTPEINWKKWDRWQCLLRQLKEDCKNPDYYREDRPKVPF